MTSTAFPTAMTLHALQDAGEDFEWYPTTRRMVDVVAKAIGRSGAESVMDVGAGDGRVLLWLSESIRRAKADGYEPRGYRDRAPTAAEVATEREQAFQRDRGPKLYGIEKSLVLVQAQPREVTPVGTDLFEQNLSCLQVDYVFCNPPYSQFELWAAAVIESAYAKRAYLVIPRRWAESARIKAAIAKRGAKTSILATDNFADAERRARAMVHIVEVRFPCKTHEGYNGRRERSDEIADPFDVWFDQNVGTFDVEPEVAESVNDEQGIAKGHKLDTIAGLVDAFDEEYGRMQANYSAIFKLDLALLQELKVEKDGLREGIKKRMEGLKTKYWQLLFDQLTTITSRLATATKERFIRKLTNRTKVAFTANNAYAVVIWATKNANRYYNEQLVDLFRALSTFDGVVNYKSNQRVWEKNQWWYLRRGESEAKAGPSHYGLDYRIVVERHSAIPSADRHGYVSDYDSPGGLNRTCHELIDDMIAVFHNLGFCWGDGRASRRRYWSSGLAHEFQQEDGSTLFRVKAFKNGNVHLQIKPDAIRALNVEAGRLMGWLKSSSDVISELGYTPEDAEKFFGSNHILAPSSVKLLAAG